MTRAIAIILCFFVTTWSVAGSSYRATSTGTQISPAGCGGTAEEHTNDDAQPAEGQPLNTQAPDGEEESEDKDETTNEKALQRVTISTLTSFLEELYSIQLLVFDEHQLEVATPPPRF